MRLLSLFLTILLFSGSSLAECRNKDCMTAQFELETMGHTFHYDEVFNIGTNWYIIFDYPENNTNKTITFEFDNGISKVHEYDNDLVTDSISFSGSAFNEEKLNLVLNITITNEDNSTSDFNLNIDINKPPADDLFYLWGGMTVFWTAIGAYVLYISTKFTKLRDK
tara:strand:- start:106 stop:603 length:498 start_codon:yes stop_codon:yes gene_type:complete